jgi:hypothetical protein
MVTIRKLRNQILCEYHGPKERLLDVLCSDNVLAMSERVDIRENRVGWNLLRATARKSGKFAGLKIGW